MHPRLARPVFWLAWLAITVLALVPEQAVPVSSGWDKIDHWLAFFTLAALADRAFGGAAFWLRIAPALVAYGVGIEIAQSFTPDRQGEAMDVVADAVGVLIYGLVRQLGAVLGLPRRTD